MAVKYEKIDKHKIKTRSKPQARQTFDESALMQLADSLDRIYTEGVVLMKKIKTAATPSATLDCELADIEAWGWYARYFADKLRGATALAQFRQSNDPQKQAEAVKNLEHGVESWKNYATTVGRYNKKEWLFQTALPLLLFKMTKLFNGDFFRQACQGQRRDNV